MSVGGVVVGYSVPVVAWMDELRQEVIRDGMWTTAQAEAVSRGVVLQQQPEAEEWLWVVPVVDDDGDECWQSVDDEWMATDVLVRLTYHIEEKAESK